jgi:hypothetical protein
LKKENAVSRVFLFGLFNWLKWELRNPSHLAFYCTHAAAMTSPKSVELKLGTKELLKDRYGEPEIGGSEWEPIKILLEGDGDSNKTNTASNTRFRLTTQVGQVHTATEVLLDLGTNKQPSEPKHTNTHI